MRFRYVNEAVGAFVLLGLLLCVGGLVLAARGRGWFEKDRRFAVKLPPEGAFGLRPGAEVRILGSVVGRVTAIDADKQGNVHAEIAIAADFGRFVRTDSIALVKKVFGVAGDAFLEISRGTGPPLPPDGVVSSMPFEELPQLVENALADIRADALPAIRELSGAAQEYRALAAELRARDGHLQRLLAGLADLAGTMNRGDGTLGRLLQDPALADRFDVAVGRIGAAAGSLDDAAGEARQLFRDLRGSATEMRGILATLRAEAADMRGLAAEAKEMLEEVRGLVADTRANTVQLPRLMAGAADAVQQLPAVLLQTQRVLRAIERLVRGMQGSWLFGGSRGAAPEPRSVRLSPAESAGR
jgi:phospholipid/cholesterol/gamma-HCH transport system substrate-binding protein